MRLIRRSVVSLVGICALALALATTGGGLAGTGSVAHAAPPPPYIPCSNPVNFILQPYYQVSNYTFYSYGDGEIYTEAVMERNWDRIADEWCQGFAGQVYGWATADGPCRWTLDNPGYLEASLTYADITALSNLYEVRDCDAHFSWSTDVLSESGCMVAKGWWTVDRSATLSVTPSICE